MNILNDKEDCPTEQTGATLGSARSLIHDGHIPQQAIRESEKAHARNGSTEVDYDLGRGGVPGSIQRSPQGGLLSGISARPLAFTGLAVALTLLLARTGQAE